MKTCINCGWSGEDSDFITGTNNRCRECDKLRQRRRRAEQGAHTTDESLASFEEIGEALGVSAEQANNIYKVAVRKLRRRYQTSTQFKKLVDDLQTREPESQAPTSRGVEDFRASELPILVTMPKPWQRRY